MRAPSAGVLASYAFLVVLAAPEAAGIARADDLDLLLEDAEDEERSGTPPEPGASGAAATDESPARGAGSAPSAAESAQEDMARPVPDAPLRPGSPPRVVEEIVVTAQKREQALVDVPLAVQQFSGESLEEQGYEDLREVIGQVPGGSIAVSSGPGFEIYQIRGVTGGTQGDASVGFYLDELAFGIPNVQLAPGSRLFDLEAVEVLRGPQGTLYGQGAMGGTIKIRTADPDLELWGLKAQTSGQMVAAGEPGHSLDAALNAPVLPGRVALRVVGGIEKLGGVAENPADFPGSEDLDDTGTRQGRVKALFDFEPLRVTLGAWQNRIDADFLRLYSSVDPPRFTDTGGRRTGLDTLWNLYTARAEYDLGFATLESGTAFIDHNLDVTIGVPLLPGAVVDPAFPIIGSLAPTLGDMTFDGDIFIDVETTGLSQELRLVSRDSGPWSWITGVFYFDAHLDSVTDFRSEIPGLSSVTTDVIKSQAWAGFGEVSYGFFGGRVVPLVGLRYFTDDRSLDDVVIDEFGNRSPQHIAKTYSALSPRFNLTAHPTDDGMAYVNVAKGFRSGALQSQTSVDAAAQVGVETSVSLPEDFLWSYELGTKWTLFDGALFLESALYYSDWSDAILQFVPTGIRPSLIEVGDIRGLGIEAALTHATFVEGLDLQLSMNLNRTRFSDPDPAAAAALDSIADGKQIPGAPKRTFAISASYVRDLGLWDLGGFGFVSYAYRSPQIGVVTNEKTQTVNDVRSRLGLRREMLELSIFGENLLDQRGPSQFQGVGLVPIYPRILGIALRMQFG